MSVTISELLAEYGDNKLRFQVLSGSLDGSQRTRAKDGTTLLSFRTEVSLSDVMHDKMEAFVVWMDKAEMKAALERVRLRKDGALGLTTTPTGRQDMSESERKND